MKFKRELIEEMAAWVAENGLVEDHGAPLKSFCAQFGIDKKTYYNWLANSTFSTAIKNAREEFRANLPAKIVVSMARSATGYDTTDVQVEKVPSPNQGGKGKLVVRRRTETTRHVPANTAAGIFLLTNLEPDKWKNTQRLEHTGKDGEDLTLSPLTMEDLELLRKDIEARTKKE